MGPFWLNRNLLRIRTKKINQFLPLLSQKHKRMIYLLIIYSSWVCFINNIFKYISLYKSCSMKIWKKFSIMTERTFCRLHLRLIYSVDNSFKMFSVHFIINWTLFKNDFKCLKSCKRLKGFIFGLYPFWRLYSGFSRDWFSCSPFLFRIIYLILLVYACAINFFL